MRIETIWTGNDALSVFLRLLLVPFSWLYSLGWRIYRLLYDAGLKKAKHPHAPIVCVGNLVVGGSGKSPFALYLAELFKGLGYEVVIGASGYGSPASEGARLAPEGPLKASEWGDEPAMIRMALPDVPLIVGRDRVMAAQKCADRYPNAILLLDDGFQHLPLKKDISILLDPQETCTTKGASFPHSRNLSPLPPSPPAGAAGEGGINRFCLPAGPYREPLSSLKRADFVFFPSDLETQPLQFETPEGTPQTPTEATVLCALGQPGKFLRAIESTGIKILAKRLLPDHDPLDAGNLWDGLPDHAPVLVTTKDWVKLRERDDLVGRKILIARHSVRVKNEELFIQQLQSKLNELAPKTI